MKMRYLVLICLTSILCALFAVQGLEAKLEAEKPLYRPEISSSEPVPVITRTGSSSAPAVEPAEFGFYNAADLYYAYNGNYEAASQKYTDKMIDVCGYVVGLPDWTVPDMLEVRLFTTTTSPAIICDFMPEAAVDAALLQKYDIAIVRGICRGEDESGNILIEECETIEQ